MRSRRRTESQREYRGTFAFPKRHEAELVALLTAREQVEFQGVIDGEQRRLKVILTDLSLESGVAFFLGLGEPYTELPKAAG